MIKWVAGTVLVLILVVLAWWRLNDSSQGKIREELVLNIPDTGQIYGIDILYRNGKQFTLHRIDNQWEVNGVAARKHAVNNLLETLHDQRVSALIPKTALDNVVKDLGSNGVRFDVKGADGESMLTFYVGGVTPDERGTFMIREGSEWPVIVNIPGFEGGLRPRYIMAFLDWKSRQIFQPVESIQSLILDYPTKQNHSLKLEKSTDGYRVTPLYKAGTEALPVHEYLVEAYLNHLNHLFAEAVLDESKRTDIDAATPFCRLTVTDGQGNMQKLEFYPKVWIDYETTTAKPQRVERYYTDYNDQTIFLTQHLLMQNIFTGYEHFVSLKDFGKVE